MAAQYTHIKYIKITFVMMLRMTACPMIFARCETCPIPARILKLICSIKLKIKNNIEYWRIYPDVINFDQNNT